MIGGHVIIESCFSTGFLRDRMAGDPGTIVKDFYGPSRDSDIQNFMGIFVWDTIEMVFDKNMVVRSSANLKELHVGVAIEWHRL